MRLISLLTMTALLSASVTTAATLTGVWQLVEVNSLPMQETPPYGQMNRKEIYTAKGELLVCKSDDPFAKAKTIGRYEVHDDIRIFTSSEGEKISTVIQWIDDNHFFFEFNPGERWYYARVTGDNARDQQWEPRSVLVIRTTEDDSGPTLRDFPYDLSDDSTMPWARRVLGAWETIKVSGRGVSGPDTPPYGMPNDRFLIGTDGTLRKVHANNESDRDGGIAHFKVEGNQLTLIEAQFNLFFWFNHWGQLVLEQDGMQTVLKRISLDATKAPAGPFVVVLLSSEREEQKVVNGKLVEVKKSAASSVSAPFPAQTVVPQPAVRKATAAHAKPTFLKPFNGGSQPVDLALAEDADALQYENALNLEARKNGLGSTSDILETNETEKFCTIRADAIDSDMQVPFGWHVVDNGDRMLVFDADHFVEISLEKKKVKSGAKAMLQEILDAQRAAQPDLHAQLMDNSGGAFLLIMYNFQDKNEVRSLAFSTHDIGLKDEILVGQITASQADLVRALNLDEVLTRHLKHQK